MERNWLETKKAISVVKNGTGILKTLAASGRFPDSGEGTRGPTQELGSFILGRGEHYDPWEAL